MKIIPIFEVTDQALYAVKHSDQETDEFDRLFNLWQDIEYLEDFFNSNKDDLMSGFFGSVSVEEAVLQTISDTRELQKQLLEIANNDEKDPKYLNSYFIPLDNSSYKPGELEKSKCYGTIDKSWIRLYAIRVPENSYIITGGAIKLTRTMGAREHTQIELQKLDNCRDYLRSEGIFGEEGLK